MTRPLLLDLFCGAGGAAMGYHRAGFDIVGVDINPQPHYPFTFVQADAMTYPLDGFDAIHASPPCQGYSQLRHLPWLRGKTYPLLLADTWQRLTDHGTPWVIENVEAAPMSHSTVLCGWTFGLPIYRHRRFGSSHLIMAPPHRRHVHVIAPGRATLNERRTASGGVMGILPYGTTQGVERSFGTLIITGQRPENRRHVGLPQLVDGSVSIADIRAAMGIDWMTRNELTQAIPPAYTEHIGRQLIGAL